MTASRPPRKNPTEIAGDAERTVHGIGYLDSRAAGAASYGTLAAARAARSASAARVAAEQTAEYARRIGDDLAANAAEKARAAAATAADAAAEAADRLAARAQAEYDLAMKNRKAAAAP